MWFRHDSYGWSLTLWGRYCAWSTQDKKDGAVLRCCCAWLGIHSFEVLSIRFFEWICSVD